MKITKTIAITLTVGIIGAMGVAYAQTAKTPAEIVAGLTGKTASEISTRRSEGKTYGTIAKEADKLNEFKAQMLEQRKAVLDQRVKDGKLTQQQADAIYNNIKGNQQSCDGDGSARIGRQNGFGQGRGCGVQGSGGGQGGCGNGQGLGCGR